MRRLAWILTLSLMLALTGDAPAAGAVQRITIIMRDFSYSPNKVTVQAGTPVEITLVNRGKVAHEFMMYDLPKAMGSMGPMGGHEWAEKTNYFRGHDVKVTGGQIERKAGAVFEIVVGPGKSATIQFTPTKKGTFEISCQISGHYEAGQKGTITVR